MAFLRLRARGCSIPFIPAKAAALLRDGPGGEGVSRRICADAHTALHRAAEGRAGGDEQRSYRTAFLLQVSKYTPNLEVRLQPLIDAETALSDVNGKINENAQKQKTLTDEEARSRENLTALKGNDAAKRFVDELRRARSR